MNVKLCLGYSFTHPRSFVIIYLFRQSSNKQHIQAMHCILRLAYVIFNFVTIVIIIVIIIIITFYIQELDIRARLVLIL